MDFVKQWTICVCLTLLVSLILTLLSPKGSMKRFYSIIISVFIFISFLYPFGNINAYDFDIEDKLNVESENAQLSEEGTYAEIIKSNICNTLKENGITGAAVNVAVTVENKEISIDDIQIAVGGEYDTEVVRKTIFENLGVNARVIHNGE